MIFPWISCKGCNNTNKIAVYIKEVKFIPYKKQKFSLP